MEDKKPDFLELTSRDSRGRSYGDSPGESSKSSKIALGFPRASCTPVEMCAVDSNFPPASFPLGELCAERQDYIQPSGCVCWGSLIQCDMYRHMARVLKEFGDTCRQRHAFTANHCLQTVSCIIFTHCPKPISEVYNPRCAIATLPPPPPSTNVLPKKE